MKYDDTVDFKVNCNSAEYFKLFESYIPKLKLGSTVLLYSISNVDCLKNIIDKNQDCVYYIYDTTAIFDVLKLINENNNIILVNDISEANMKFDCIIMNPPYQKNLHLKILEKAISMLKDENSVCVNLSPILWIEDPHAHKKVKSNLNKFNNSIINKCESLEIINAKKSNEIFNIGLFANLGIYKCSISPKTNIDSKTFWMINFKTWEIELFNKLYNNQKHINDVVEKNKRDGIRVLIASIAGNRGALPIYKDISYVIDGTKNGIDWTKCKNNGGYEKQEGSNIPLSIKFLSEIEAENFYNSYKTTFMCYICNRFLFDQNIPLQFLPFMDDYTEPWTNERFYKHFNITKEEQAVIEKEIEKYS